LAEQVGWLDTNLFVHAYQDDDRSAACRALICGLEDGSVEGWLHPLVLHELSYVLRNLLRWDRRKIADLLLALVLAPGVRVAGDAAVLADGILRWRDSGTAFADAFLAAEAVAAGLPVCSANSGDIHRAGAACIVPHLDGGSLQLPVLPPPPRPSSAGEDH
jgi:predicted nucleic acid-binding protein